MASEITQKIARGASFSGDVRIAEPVQRRGASSANSADFTKILEGARLPRVKPFFKFIPPKLSEARESIGMGILFVRRDGPGKYSTNLTTLFVTPIGGERYVMNKSALTDPSKSFPSLEQGGAPLNLPDFQKPKRKSTTNLGDLREMEEGVKSDGAHRVNIVVFRGEVTGRGKSPEGILIVADKFSQDAIRKIAASGSESLETRFSSPTEARSEVMNLIYGRIENELP